MMQYLVEVSVKPNATADFAQRMPMARVTEDDLLYMFAAYDLQQHTYLRMDGAPTFYSPEGVYPMARLLVVDELCTPLTQSKMDRLLAKLDSRPLPITQRAHSQASV